MTALEALRRIQPNQILSSEEVFNAIFEAGSELCDSDRESEAALEITIRLLEARRNNQIPINCVDAIELLAEEFGLYPYIEPSHFNHLTQIIIEAHSIPLRDKIYLHAKQMQILLWLLDGDNVILSAPTSFGKSLLVDAFIEIRKPKNIVVILPTIALIDEFRRRFTRYFGDYYSIITTISVRHDEGRPSMFVLTQERFLQRNDELDIDFLFIDEFYKLDPDRGDNRFETLNLALYRALPRAKVCFMAGPHIQKIDLGERWNGNFRFVQTDYRTVTVNVIDRSEKYQRLEAFLEDLRSVGNAASLVFTSAPGSAQNLLSEISEAGFRYDTNLGQELGHWIAENYGIYIRA